jgi:glutamate dehydrogenase (NADP+)
MNAQVHAELEKFMSGLIKRNQGETEFHQAVREVAESVMPLVLANPNYKNQMILERLTEPDRIVIFRVSWEDDQGNTRVNRAWRVQFSNAIGPYKGGLRFHPSVNQSILKFLGFEQIFKNSLTGLPMGGAKGGSNFNPKGKSEREVMRFCHSLMVELSRHIGADMDVPAGDIGVGAREIGFMFGQYKRLKQSFKGGAITGKGLAFGGSLIRKEATGYGCVYFSREMLARTGDSLAGKTCVISGSGNVAIYTAEKALELGAKVVALSDSSGYIHDPSGLTVDKLALLKELKEVKRERISEYAEQVKEATFHAKKRPWEIPCDVAFPCATQNELDGADAKVLIKNGVKVVSEGANMPVTHDGIKAFLDAKVLYAPGKAANAGGVSVSGLEQAQNSMRISWTRTEVDNKLQEIMKDIHEKCIEFGARKDGSMNYVDGANVAGFKKVADAMIAYGIV